VAISSYRLPWQELNPTAQELAGIAEMEFEMRTQTAKEADILAYPEWQKPVQEALIELDHEKLQARMSRKNARSAGGAWCRPKPVRRTGRRKPADQRLWQAGRQNSEIFAADLSP